MTTFTPYKPSWADSPKVSTDLERFLSVHLSPHAHRARGETQREMPLNLSRDQIQSTQYALKFVSSPRQLSKYYGLPITDFNQPRQLALESLDPAINRDSHSGGEMMVSILHLLVASGKSQLARALILRYNLDGEFISGLPGPSLILLTIHVFLHPGDVKTYVGDHQVLLTAGYSDWEALTLLGELLYLGVKTYFPKTALISIALEISYNCYESVLSQLYRQKADPALLINLETKLRALCSVILASSISWGISSIIRRVSIIGVALFPSVYQMICDHSRAVVIQRAWRRHHYSNGSNSNKRYTHMKPVNRLRLSTGYVYPEEDDQESIERGDDCSGAVPIIALVSLTAEW